MTDVGDGKVGGRVRCPGRGNGRSQLATKLLTVAHLSDVWLVASVARLPCCDVDVACARTITHTHTHTHSVAADVLFRRRCHRVD